MKRLLTRRQALAGAGRTGVAVAITPQLIRWVNAAAGTPLSPSQLRTLRAAVARIVPAQGPGDWSGADVGADNYIVMLLAGTGSIYAGGPYRSRFLRFQRLSRVKRIGWTREIRRLRTLYGNGLAELDRRAGGNFAAALPAVQDVILTTLDDTGSDFFGALFNHTMEGVYSHPAYGGNRDYRAWQAVGYAGDVHGVRFPHIGPPDAPWNVYGGYAPEEMAQPGKESA
jgi:gluconate 2-dehydrogenase gamma chain